FGVGVHDFVHDLAGHSFLPFGVAPFVGPRPISASRDTISNPFFARGNRRRGGSIARKAQEKGPVSNRKRGLFNRPRRYRINSDNDPA
ncbi:MAG: hypothetical protein WBQ53_07450, partial [Methylocystis sp.]